jgi:mono/diheme cytochrome c family protein
LKIFKGDAMKSKLFTFLPAFLMIFLLRQGLNEPIQAQQNATPPIQNTAPPTQGKPAPTPSTPAPGQNTLSPGPGQETTSRICSGCHALTVITSSRKSADDWAGTVDQMRSRGADGTDEEFDQIVKYLAANFGPSTTPPQP